jgi:hypothetical protein
LFSIRKVSAGITQAMLFLLIRNPSCNRYVAITNDDEIAFVTLGDWGCGPDNCRVPSTAPEGFHHGGINQHKVAKAMAKAGVKKKAPFRSNPMVNPKS